MKNLIGIKEEGEKLKLYVENIKCGGCANTITKSLAELKLSEIVITPETSVVEFINPHDEKKVLEVLKKLKNLGYPLIETEEGLNAALLKAKSYLSCALGKFS